MQTIATPDHYKISAQRFGRFFTACALTLAVDKRALASQAAGSLLLIVARDL